jgi:hypothetical protein
MGALLLHFTVWESAFVFSPDQEQFFLLARQLANDGIFTFHGPSIGPFQFHHGPLFYVLLTPLMWISGSPVFIRFVVVVLFVLAAGLLYRVLSFRISRMAALFTAGVVLLSRFGFENCRWLWHSSFLPLLCVGTLFCLHKLMESHRWRHAVAAGVGAALAVQLHVQMVTLAVVVLLAFGLRRRQLGWRGLSAGLGAAMLAGLPFFLGLFNSVTEGHLEEAQQWMSVSQRLGMVDPFYIVQYLGQHLGTGWVGYSTMVTPWLTLLLIGVGSVVVLRRKDAFGVLLLVGLVCGVLLQIRLMGHSVVPRYLHCSAWFALGLLGFGVDQIFSLLRVRPITAGVGILALLLAMNVEAALSPPPTPYPPVPYNGAMQTQVARVVAPLLGPQKSAEGRAHGMYVSGNRNLLAFGYLQQVYGDGDPALRLPIEEHVLVLPEQVRVTPLAMSKINTVQVEGYDTITVMTYRPALDYSQLVIEGPAAKQVYRRWILLRNVDTGTGYLHRLRIPVLKAGTVHIALRSKRGAPDCPLEVLADGQRLVQSEVAAPFARLVAVAVPAPGQLEVNVGPCHEVPRVDLF